MAHIKNCILCGKQYEYCPRCNETEPTYKLKWCSANCNNIFLTLNKVSFKHLTKEQAADELEKLDLSDMDKYSEQIKAYIQDILSSKKVVETETEVKEEEDIIGEISKVENLPVKKSKRNKK